MALTDKQESFIREYLVDLNATAAYIRAGYEKNGANANASRLMANDSIRARIEESQQKRAEQLQLDAQWVLRRLRDISDRCMTAEPVMAFNYESKQLEETGEYKFDSQGANKATELIGKHLGMFVDKQEITGRLVMFKGEGDLED